MYLGPVVTMETLCPLQRAGKCYSRENPKKGGEQDRNKSENDEAGLKRKLCVRGEIDGLKQYPANRNVRH